MSHKKHYHIKHLNNYTLVEFNKNENDILKIIKKYGYRNCKKDIQRHWINLSLENCDKGFVYFNTEIIETKNENNEIIKTDKYRPCAYLCLKIINEKNTYLSLVCSLYTEEHLGTKLINEAIKYSLNNGYEYITLDSISEKTTKYYSKKGFEIKEKPMEKIGNITYMIKKLK